MKAICETSNLALQNMIRVVEHDLERFRQLQRNQQQISRAVRIGINYRSANVGANFVVFINEDFPIIQ
jgi:hypothetical protein